MAFQIVQPNASASSHSKRAGRIPDHEWDVWHEKLVQLFRDDGVPQKVIVDVIAKLVQKELKSTINLGIAYQLRGMPGAFYYKGPEDVNLNKSESLKEKLQIGEVG